MSGDLVASRYNVVRLIGSGGTGEVYEAIDTALGESCFIPAYERAPVGQRAQASRQAQN